MSRNSASTELRLALAMRGGVSLAIWIGGACAEIDRLRRAGSGDDVWTELLEQSAYDDVIVDVIAGASAGGLNGVFFATSQHYGYSLDELRELWLELGGLHDLVRTEDPRLSLLNGDLRFLAPLQSRLEKFTGGAIPSSPPRVDLQLSATLVEPIIRPARSTDDEALTDQRFMSRFQFRHEPRAPWTRSDFPTAGAELEAATWRWALAARASSSYPVAFEPAVVRATRPSRFGERAENGGASTVDMRGVFTDLHGFQRDGEALEPDDFVVADGGILDNIPLGKALDAIAAAPAERPTQRYLVYLHPNGPSMGNIDDDRPSTDEDGDQPTEAVLRDYRRSAYRVLTGALRARQWTETTTGDIAQLEAHNEAVRRADTIRLGTCARIEVATNCCDPSQTGEGDGTETDEVAALVRYARQNRTQYYAQRAHRDATVVRALLDDPITVIGEDEFPVVVDGRDGPVVVPQDRWRSPLAHWRPDERRDLTSGLLVIFDRFNESADAVELDPMLVFTAGTGPLERVLRLLIEWARILDLDNEPVPAGDISPGASRRRLYTALSFVKQSLAHSRNLGWVTVAAARKPVIDQDWDAAAALLAVDSLVEVDDARAIAKAIHDLEDDGGEPDAQGVEESASTPGDTLRGFSVSTYRRLDALALQEADGAATAPDLRMAILQWIVAPIAADLARLHLGATPDGSTPDGAMNGPHCMYGHLARAIGTQPPDELRAAETLEALAALEIACYQEFVGGVRGSAITFTRISAANRTPLADRFEKLRDGNGPTWQRPVGAPPFATGIHPSRKLAGNELNNFAAFVKPEWRANDWMWGRLDAVPTLVDILVTPESIAGALQREGIDELVSACQWLHDIIATPHDDVDGAWQEFLTTEVWEPMSNRIGDELEAILAQAAGAGVDAIRDAFVARRQWEILAEELALPTTPAGTASPTLSPVDTSTRVAQHRVGVQTLTAPRHRDNVDLFQDLSRAAGQALVGNAEAVRDRRGRSGSKPDRVDEVTRIAGATLQRLGGIASSLWLAPASTLVSWRRLGSILAAIAVIGAVVWAFLSDWKVALIALVGGIAVTLFLLGGFVVLRRPAKRSPAAGET